MAIPILRTWHKYFETDFPNEGLGSSYERVVLNNKLIALCQKFHCDSILETPIFGFTGITGINSMELARKKKKVHLLDTNAERLKLVKSVWDRMGYPAKFSYQTSYTPLPLSDKSIDMSWNFSALWFVENLPNFLTELTRVTRKIIFICVPNRSGIGYLSQKYISGADLKSLLKEEHIIPKNIITAMDHLGWKLTERNYIDVPPWPDIGMEKEAFLRFFHLSFLLKEDEPTDPLSILPYYKNKNAEFPACMMKYFWFERYAPQWIKRIWAHHRYLLFIPK